MYICKASGQSQLCSHKNVEGQPQDVAPRTCRIRLPHSITCTWLMQHLHCKMHRFTFLVRLLCNMQVTQESCSRPCFRKLCRDDACPVRPGVAGQSKARWQCSLRIPKGTTTAFWNFSSARRAQSKASIIGLWFQRLEDAFHGLSRSALFGGVKSQEPPSGSKYLLL